MLYREEKWDLGLIFSLLLFRGKIKVVYLMREIKKNSLVKLQKNKKNVVIKVKNNVIF